MLFENHYERTSEVMKELFGAIYFKRPLTVIIYLALGVIAAISVAEMIGSGVFHLGGWVYLVIFALMDDTIHDEDYVLQNYDCPILAKVPNLLNSGSKHYGYYYQAKDKAKE